MVRKSSDEENTTAPEIDADENSTAVAPLDGFTEETLKTLDSFEEVISQVGPVANAADVLGYGYSLLEDKSRLIGQELMIVRYGIHKSDLNGRDFSSIHVLTRDGGKYIVNDGSTGIHVQLKELKEEQGTVCPLYVPKGLRVSEYDYTDENDGVTKKARTYYLNTAK
jgi:hypothetical protein